MVNKRGKKPTSIQSVNKINEQYIQKILDATPAMIVVYNINTGEYLFVNKTIKKILGYTSEDFTKKGLPFVMSLVHPDDVSQILKKNAKALNDANKRKTLDTEPIINFEYRMRHKNGTWRWLHTDGSVFSRGKDGKVDCVLNASLDITDRKLADEKLQSVVRYGLEQQLAAIVTSSNDAIISKDMQGIITSWNRAAEKIYGYTEAEAVGQSIMLIIPPELRKEEEKVLAQLKKGKEIDHYETIRMTKNGRRIAVSISISPIRDENGMIIGSSKIARDITQQKQIEENLRFLAESSKLLSSSLDYNTTLQRIANIAIPHIADWVAVDILNERGEIMQVAVHHRDPKQVKWAKAYRKQNPPSMSSDGGVQQVLRTGKSTLIPHITDEMLTAAAKNKKELELTRGLHFTSAIMVPILIKGKAVGVISFITTDSKRIYDESDLAMVEEIASRAALAIENATLYRQAQREIEQRKILERQKDDFIGVASHELKTPVTSIKSFAQVLQLRFAREGNTNAVELLRKLDAQVDKLTSLIGDLLDVTKIEAGRLQFTEEYFSFDALVAELQEELQRTTEKHHLMLTGKTGKTIFGDRERVGQVITNLVSNAIKYSPHTKDIILTMSVEKNMVKLCVQDFGIGISQDKQKRVFERFFRASGPNQETYPGLGLGLYVSNEIIKRLQGSIWVESREGEGSTFCFTLPIMPKKHVKRES